MRHRNLGRKLSRNSEHRYAMMRNMATSLLIHEAIRTTEAKAKELSRFADKLITLTRTDDVHSRRQAYKILCNHQMVARLFDIIGPAFVGVPGGFTRVVKLGLPRVGDAAPMAIIELTHKSAEPAAPKKATKKSAEISAPKAPEAAAPEAAPEAAVEAATKKPARKKPQKAEEGVQEPEASPAGDE